MKNTLIVALISIILMSCTADDNSNTTTHELEGKWKLSTMNGFGIDIQYQENDILWSFNTTENIISVIISSTAEMHSLLPLKNNGNYSYNITDNNVIMLNDIYSDVEYNYEINNNQLILTLRNVQDPTVLIFKR